MDFDWTHFDPEKDKLCLLEEQDRKCLFKKKKNTAPPPVESGKGLSPVILNKGSKAKARADEGCPVEGRWRTPAVGRMRKY